VRRRLVEHSEVEVRQKEILNRSRPRNGEWDDPAPVQYWAVQAGYEKVKANANFRRESSNDHQEEKPKHKKRRGHGRNLTVQQCVVCLKLLKIARIAIPSLEPAAVQLWQFARAHKIWPGAKNKKSKHFWEFPWHCAPISPWFQGHSVQFAR
jgi:hypothetical protein